MNRTMPFPDRPIDIQAAAFFCRGCRKEEREALLAVVALLSQAIGMGNICLDLGEIAGAAVTAPGRPDLQLPEREALRAMVASMPSVGSPGDHRPLVLDGAGRLYFYRYWRYEENLAGAIRLRISGRRETMDQALLEDGLRRLFPTTPDEGPDLQMAAAASALRHSFTLLSGGPGTGKTSTVVRILCLLLEQPEGLRQRIAMAAPTGKAAARLAHSIASVRSRLDTTEEVRHAIPETVSTIHRLLGMRSAGEYRHTARNPLPHDTVIVDEASMVDLPLMAALVSAMRPDARIILLGDRDQLASVEAGAVLGDICRAAAVEGSGIAGCVTFLEKAYRFSTGSGIGELSRAVNRGDAEGTIRMLSAGAHPSIAFRDVPTPSALNSCLAKTALEGYREYLEAGTPSEALRLFDRFRVLCALREGNWGAAGINRAIEGLLRKAGLVGHDATGYEGRPVLVTRNDYPLQLFNGDIGILLPDPDAGGLLRAFFHASDGSLRSIPPELLPEHETAFAMTVHKSQGSEFERVVMVMPPADNPILTRELLYTGITRARGTIEIWGEREVFSTAIGRRTERRSGLCDALSRAL